MGKLYVTRTDSECLSDTLTDIQENDKYEIVQIIPNVHTEHSGDLVFIVTTFIVLYREKEKNPYDNIKVI